jgi:hypothetical protein
MARAYPTPREPSPQDLPDETTVPAEQGFGAETSPAEGTLSPEDHDVSFTLLWLRMLVDGFELAESLPRRFVDNPVPARLWGTLRRGTVPSRATLGKLTPELRHELRLQSGAACGYRMLELMEQEEACALARELGEREGLGHALGLALFLILGLVLTVPPSEAMVACLTAGFSNRPKDLERVESFLEELMVALMARYTQDLMAELIEEEGLDPEELQARLLEQLPLDL